MRFVMPFALFLTCIIAPDWYWVYSFQRSCREWCILCLFFFVFDLEVTPPANETESQNTVPRTLDRGADGSIPTAAVLVHGFQK